MRLIIDAVPALVAYVGADLRYSSCNKAYEGWFGRTQDELIGRTVADVLGDEVYEMVRQHVETALAGVRVGFDSWIPYRDLGLRFVHADYVPDVAPDGRVAGMFVLVTDHTQRQREQARRDALAVAMRELNEATLDLPELLKRLAHCVTTSIGDVAVIRLVSPDGEWLETAAVDHVDPAARDLLVSVLDAPRVHVTDAATRPLLIDGAEEMFFPTLQPGQARTFLLKQHHPFVDAFDLRAGMAVPLRAGDRVLGVIMAGRTSTTDPYIADDLAFLHQLADGAALALRNAGLHQDLRHREEHHRLLTDTLPALIMIARPDGNGVSFNLPYLEYTGLDTEQAREQGYAAVIHPTDRQEWVDMWQQALAAGEAAQGEVRLRRHDGVYRWHLTKGTPVRGRDGVIERWMTVCIDIDDRKAAERERQHLEQALRASEAHYRSLVESAPALILTTRLNGSMEYCSDSYLEYTGLTFEDALDYDNHSPMHLDDLPRAKDNWARALKTGTPLQHEVRLRRYDGVYRWFLVNFAPVRSDAETIIRWIGVILDIEDRKLIEQEREHLTHELERANAAKDEFLGLVSHELRTPITTIFGNAQVLRRRGARIDEEGRAQALADIEWEADRLQRIIENMLILARVDSRQPAEAEPISIVRTVRAFVAEHKARNPAREVTVEVEGDVPFATGQHTYVELVMRNLVSNAEKYARESSPIGVRISRYEDEVRVTVADECGGIAEDDIEHLFTPFFRSPRTAHRAAGAGIGLAVCQRLVAAMDGRIWAESDGHTGCEITFSLPVEPGS